jgi:hypothetical protein
MKESSLRGSPPRNSICIPANFELLQNLVKLIFINSRKSRVQPRSLSYSLKFMNTKIGIHSHHLMITIYIHLYSQLLSICNKMLFIRLFLHFLFHPYTKYIKVHMRISFMIVPHFQKT